MALHGGLEDHQSQHDTHTYFSLDKKWWTDQPIDRHCYLYSHAARVAKKILKRNPSLIHDHLQATAN